MRLCVFIIGSSLLAHIASAASMPAHVSREPMVRAENLHRWSVAAQVQDIERDIVVEQWGAATIEAVSYSGLLGFDVLPWLTIFAGVGSAEARLDGESGYGDSDTQWSAGVSAFLWSHPVMEPSFMAGRVTIKAGAELARYESSQETGDLEWEELFASATVGYELSNNADETRLAVPVDIEFFAGPAWSTIDGTWDTAAGERDFDEDEELGVAAGIDIFFADRLIVGAHVQSFSEISYGGSVRFHF